MAAGSWWRGRPMPYHYDERAVENERQRWVDERLAGEAEVIADLVVDPARAYAEWRAEWEATGDEHALEMMLAYVIP